MPRIDEPPTPPPPPGRIKRREVKAGMKEDIYSLPEGDVVLQWAENLSADSYKEIEDWTKLMLRKMKRNVGDENAQQTSNGDGPSKIGSSPCSLA